MSTSVDVLDSADQEVTIIRKTTADVRVDGQVSIVERNYKPWLRKGSEESKDTARGITSTLVDYRILTKNLFANDDIIEEDATWESRD